MLTLLTATGCRPEAWRICERLMERQTYTGDVHWIIVDDGETLQPITFDRPGWVVTIIMPTPKWKTGDNTQARNLAEGLRMVGEKDRLVIIEDDDSYHPDWLATVDYWLDSHDLVGEKLARYYNIHTKRARQLNNTQHASLCCTAMKGAAIKEFSKELKPNVQFIDLHLWKNFKGSKALYDSKMVTGIKGMAGRGGIGMGHKRDFQGQFDESGSILRQWTGTSADLYP
jgi:hypothetical protein